MLPWSVIPTAGCPSATALATTSWIRAAPSSIENSVWASRWTNYINVIPTVAGSRRPCRARPPTVGRDDAAVDEVIMGGLRAQTDQGGGSFGAELRADIADE